ncbi:MAG: hypothetical protein LBP68_02715, partial [Acidobacteriota bacterium]|nr:hypothetical protein [Acidobacteriota bacterium]
MEQQTEQLQIQQTTGHAGHTGQSQSERQFEYPIEPPVEKEGECQTERPAARMEQWTIDLRNSITSGERIAADFGGDASMAASIDEVCRNYPMRIPRYYYNLIRAVGDPIWRQAVPSAEELMDECAPEDPLHEEEDSPVPRLTHRYPDRVLLLITDRC